MVTEAQLLEAYLEESWRERQAADPLRLWQPHAKQQVFIDAVLDPLRSNTWENWMVAANRSGKSDAGSFCGATLARYGSEPLRPALGPSGAVWDRATSGWVACVNFRTLWETIEPKYFNNQMVPLGGRVHPPFIPEREIAEWRRSERMLRLKNGSIIGFRSYDSGQLAFASAGKDWIHFDEEPPKPIYKESVIRVEAGRRLRIFGTCTLLPPEGMVGGISWIFSEIIQPYLRGNRTIGVFGASIYDNPHLAPEEIARLEATYPAGSTDRAIRLNGEWLPGVGGTRCYGNFRYAIHVKPLPPLDPHAPLVWCLDFNVSPFCTLVGQRLGKMFLFHDEMILEEGSVPLMAQEFNRRYPQHPHEVWLYGDASGGASDVQSGRSDYDLLLRELRHHPSPLRMRVPPGNPHVRERVNAVNYALRNEDGSTQVLVDPRCKELIADLEGVLMADDGTIKKTFKRDDPYFRRTHTSDAAGYWVHAVQPVVAIQQQQVAPIPRQAMTKGFQWRTLTARNGH